MQPCKQHNFQNFCTAEKFFVLNFFCLPSRSFLQKFLKQTANNTIKKAYTSLARDNCPHWHKHQQTTRAIRIFDRKNTFRWLVDFFTDRNGHINCIWGPIVFNGMLLLNLARLGLCWLTKQHHWHSPKTSTRQYFHCHIHEKFGQKWYFTFLIKLLCCV